jgi:hypothetical protein
LLENFRQDWKGLPGININLSGPFHEVTRKIKCCEYIPWGHIHNTPFLLNLKIETVSDKENIEPLVSYEENSVVNTAPGTVLTTLHFLLNS